MALRILVAGLLAAMTSLAAPGPALAGRATTDLRAEQEEIEREVAQAAAVLENATETAQEAATAYAAASAALPAAQARAADARGQVAAAQTQVATAERVAADAAEALTEATEQFETSAAEMAEARDEVAEFAVAAYRGSGPATFNVLVRASGPTELMERLTYLSYVAASQRAAVDHLAAVRLQARHHENVADLAFQEAETARLVAETALAGAETAQAAADLAAAEVAALVATQAGALAVAETERDESLHRYEQAQAEAARIEAELREWEAAQRAKQTAPRQRPRAPAPAPEPRRDGSVLQLPAQGWLSSQYGMRHDPFFGVWQLHAGIDIAAPGGAPIYAADSGTVIRAGWNGGYGNFTCVGHGTHQGRGLSTCYAHQSAILVSAGQWVERGQLIGRVGTTGASTGNHLHFEVRLDGAPTDPRPYLPPL